MNNGLAHGDWVFSWLKRAMRMGRKKSLEPLGDPVEIIPCRRQDGVDAIPLASLEIISVQSVF